MSFILICLRFSFVVFSHLFEWKNIYNDSIFNLKFICEQHDSTDESHIILCRIINANFSRYLLFYIFLVHLLRQIKIEKKRRVIWMTMTMHAEFVWSFISKLLYTVTYLCEWYLIDYRIIIISFKAHRF